MDNGGTTVGGVKLETIVYIGIAADVVLAVVVGVLIVWWRNNSKKRRDAKIQAYRDAAADSRSDFADDGSVTPRQVDRPPDQVQGHQQLAGERVASRSVHRDMRIGNIERGLYQNGAVAWSLHCVHSGEVRTEFTEVEEDFGFLNDNQSGKSQQSGHVVSGPPPHVIGAADTRVSFHEAINSENQEDGAYTVENDERVVHNPLSASRKSANAFEEETTEEHEVAKSVYYTYNDPPTLETPQDLVEGDEADAPSSLDYLEPLQTSAAYEEEEEEARESVASEEAYSPPSPPPPPPPPLSQEDEVVFMNEESTNHYYSSLDSQAKAVETEVEEVRFHDMAEWSKMNFGYEEPEKRYIIQLEDSTDVM
ncbi:uncharacterized protein [Haliotis cracherodii]|uniref:uncharacterized protein n=1 Tax=Haliotis cracherodii TaxID=6455 RepID=UPI0039EC407E